MYHKDDARLGLAQYLTALSAELPSATAKAETHDLPFGLDSVTLEIDTSFTLAGSAEARSTGELEFWVTDATTQATNQSAATPLRDMQRLSVRLSPRSVDVDVARPHDVSLSLLPRKRFPD